MEWRQRGLETTTPDAEVVFEWLHACIGRMTTRAADGEEILDGSAAWVPQRRAMLLDYLRDGACNPGLRSEILQALWGSNDPGFRRYVMEGAVQEKDAGVRARMLTMIVHEASLSWTGTAKPEREIWGWETAEAALRAEKDPEVVSQTVSSILSNVKRARDQEALPALEFVLELDLSEKTRDKVRGVITRLRKP